jgi:hypothetical protein
MLALSDLASIQNYNDLVATLLQFSADEQYTPWKSWASIEEKHLRQCGLTKE